MLTLQIRITRSPRHAYSRIWSSGDMKTLTISSPLSLSLGVSGRDSHRRMTPEVLRYWTVLDRIAQRTHTTPHTQAGIYGLISFLKYTQCQRQMAFSRQRSETFSSSIPCLSTKSGLEVYNKVHSWAGPSSSDLLPSCVA